MAREAWRHSWSLKSRLAVLGTLAAASIAVAAFLSFQMLRQTESAVVGDAARQLTVAGDQMANRYHYLSASFLQRDVPSPLAAHEEILLTQLTEAGLAGYQGVEGGFYTSVSDSLIGYAYPTYQGTGKKTDVPAAEEETIRRVARRAFSEGNVVTEQTDAARDVLLFYARPVLAGGRVEGALWLMHRLSGVHAIGAPLYGWGVIILLALIAGIAAWASFTVRQLSRGVETLDAGLLALERDLRSEIGSQAGAELDRIAAAINRLGRSLREQREHQVRLEADLRRADKLAALGRLVAAVAHEVRNPLASIRLKVQRSIKAIADPQKLSQNFDVIEAEIDRLDHLVDRLLQLAKPIHLQPTPIDFNRFVAERTELHRARADSHKGEIIFAPGALVASIPGDQDRLGQVLDNILTNALEALPVDGGRIQVTTASINGGPQRVALTVTDTGKGIPSGEINRLFEPFYTTKDNGTGLGLFLAAEIVRAHGGEITVESQPGTGTTVQVILPC
jgi:signal transduction histidine kinase